MFAMMPMMTDPSDIDITKITPFINDEPWDLIPLQLPTLWPATNRQGGPLPEHAISVRRGIGDALGENPEHGGTGVENNGEVLARGAD